jgi:uncharacterized membrane protein
MALKSLPTSASAKNNFISRGVHRNPDQLRTRQKAIRGAVIASAMGIPALCAVAWPSPARADFTVCNQTALPVTVAVAHVSPDGTEFMSEGWWTLGGGGDCKMLVATSETADRTTYYLYGHGDGGRVWKGDHPFCTTERAFTIHDALQPPQLCAERGYDSRNFQEEKSTTVDHTTNLTDGSVRYD